MASNSQLLNSILKVSWRWQIRICAKSIDLVKIHLKNLPNIFFPIDSPNLQRTESGCFINSYSNRGAIRKSQKSQNYDCPPPRSWRNFIVLLLVIKNGAKKLYGGQYPHSPNSCHSADICSFYLSGWCVAHLKKSGLSGNDKSWVRINMK